MVGHSQTSPVWINSLAAIPEHPLSADIETDVCVIGAGIAGLSTAYMLAREGKSVVVLDDGPIGGGETGRTTAHLSVTLDRRYCQIESLHGANGARLAAASHRAAIDCIEEIIGREGIDCDFQRLDGFLFAPPGHSIEELERRETLPGGPVWMTWILFSTLRFPASIRAPACAFHGKPSFIR
jgi:hypothetical protein